MSNQDNIEIKPIEFSEKDLNPLTEPTPEEFYELYMRELGITQKDFEALRDTRPKTSDQYRSKE